MAPAYAAGLITGCGVIVYDGMIKLVQFYALTSDAHPLDVLPGLAWHHVLLVPPTAGGLIARVLSLRFSSDGGGHGVPKVIGSITIGNGTFRWQTTIRKSLSSAFTIGSTLKQSSLRTEYELRVIAVRHRSLTGEAPLSNPNEQFQPKDHLVLVGRNNDFSLLLEHGTDRDGTKEN